MLDAGLSLFHEAKLVHEVKVLGEVEAHRSRFGQGCEDLWGTNPQHLVSQSLWLRQILTLST